MQNMDYFNEAFNGFDPCSDEDAAMKFCLNAVLMDRRFTDLARLLPDKSSIGGIEGEPGWIIERRNEGETKGYETWPKYSRFRAFVNPDSYGLGYPEFFCDNHTFATFVRSAIRAYCSRHPERDEEVKLILEQMPLAPTGTF
jgi:hypothetical protein